ncbi:MAG: response regulator [Bdellovibrionales bacterium]|nr:response regulator [Bdellovibrionales bacterium]MBT3525679.1 response regulator [Bdellovibrionales bacterium]MBT7669459.1 response regulator [Bdellovibrionales bacterium]MBT7767855.1 response regulator [Bdellovibrionales bacterium]
MKSNSEITVLIVDDEDDIRESILIELELEGFNVKSASGGIEAFELVQNNKIDFVLTDVRMPQGGGQELLSNIKERDINLPVVLLVTGFTELSKDEAVTMGAVDLMAKPIDIDKVVKIIGQYRAQYP